MRAIASHKSSAKTVGLEELENRIVFDGAIDQAPQTDVSDAMAVTGEDSHSQECERTEVPEGNETLADGTVHYWLDYSDETFEQHYDHYWYTNGEESFTYVGSYWQVNGNGWDYIADSTNYWDFTMVEWDISGNGVSYWGNVSGEFTYHGNYWTAGLGWEYIASSSDPLGWYYNNVAYDEVEGGTLSYTSNGTGYFDYNFTWDNGYSYDEFSDPGVGDPNWYVAPDVTAPEDGEWYASSLYAGYYQHDSTDGSYTVYSADFETYYYYFPAVYYSNYGDSGFNLHAVESIGGDPGVNYSWDYDCPIYSGPYDQWYLAGDGEYMEGWWTYNDSDAQYSAFTTDFQTYDYYYIGFWYSSLNGYEYQLMTDGTGSDWTLPELGDDGSAFVPTDDHLRVDVVDAGSEWNDQPFHYATPMYNAENDYWAFTIVGDTTGEVLMRYYVENPSANFDPWAIVNGTDTSTIDLYVGMYYDEQGTYWGMEQDYLQEDVRAIWYDLPDFNVESWSYYTQLLAYAEDTTIDQMVYSGHGNVNNFWVGEDVIASWSIDDYAGDLQEIGSVMSYGAQLQLWESLIAGDLNTDGQDAIDARNMLADLAYYTGSTVFASADNTWMIQEDNGQVDTWVSYYGSDWTMEFGVDPSGTQVAYTTLVYSVYDNSNWDPDWEDISPYGEIPGEIPPDPYEPPDTFDGHIFASVGALYDEFGSSVAISGDYAIVGAPGEVDSSGCAYIFELGEDGWWTESQYLYASDWEADDLFGFSVAISGDTAIVGAPGNDLASGSAYVFDLVDGWWTETNYLFASDWYIGDYFGWSVGVSGDYAIVGAPGEVDSSGCAYIYALGTDYYYYQTESAYLSASDWEADALFGTSVAISVQEDSYLTGSGVAIVGAPGAYDASGNAYIYEMSPLTDAFYLYDEYGWSGNMTETQLIFASDWEAGDEFGHSVAISGDGQTAIVGAPGDWYYSGCAYIYESGDGWWTETHNLYASDWVEYDQFGYSVAISGDGQTAIVGAPMEYYYSGCAYTFDLGMSDYSLTETQYLYASDWDYYDEFGYSVAISGDGQTAIVGAPYDLTTDGATGSAWIFNV